MRHKVRWASMPAFVLALAIAGTAGTAGAGKPPPSEPAQYAISMSNLGAGAMGVTSDCGQTGPILGREEQGRLTFLHADGDNLNLNLHTDVEWTRKYPVAAGAPTSGTFDDCYGVTPSLDGNLFLDWETDRGQSVIHVIWHFDYYIASGVREHFTLYSEHIPFPEWTGGNVSGRVYGTFDLQYSLREGKRVIASYRSLTNGEGRDFDFQLTITKVS